MRRVESYKISALLLALIHRSAWKGNSRKFAVASSPLGWGLSPSGWGSAEFLVPIGTALVAFVARIRIKRLRLATSGLPENFPLASGSHNTPRPSS